MARTPAPVVVIGGGITGLVAAWDVKRSGADVLLLEADAACGGKIRSGRIGGIPIELGADAFLARDDTATSLIASLDLTGRLIEPSLFAAAIVTTDGLKRMPPNVMGIPTSPLTACRTGLLTPSGALRAACERLHLGPLRGPDVSVGSFISTRFGSQVLDRMVDPLLAGTRAGAPAGMSLAAAMPDIDRIARSHGSVSTGLGKRTGHPTFYSLEGGLSTLIEALVTRLQDSMRPEQPVHQILRDGRNFLVFAADQEIAASAIVMAVPSHSSAPILREGWPDAAALLREMAFASVAVVALRVPDSFPVPQEISGILKPSSVSATITACTFYSQKWPASTPDDGTVLLRCFVGRTPGDLADHLDDDGLIAAVADDLSLFLEARVVPIEAHVHRWNEGLPELRVDHLERVAAAQDSLGDGVSLAGSGYRGTGIPDCIRQGREAAIRALRYSRQG